MSVLVDRIVKTHKIAHDENGGHPHDERGMEMFPYRCTGCGHTGHRRQGTSWADVRALHVAEALHEEMAEILATSVEALEHDRDDTLAAINDGWTVSEVEVYDRAVHDAARLIRDVTS